MNELQLKYGCNPNQKPSRIFMEDGSDLPITVLCGRPGYINFLDALNGWQLVSELKRETGLPAATSFKHVSPAGAAVGLPLTKTLRRIYWVDDMKEDLSPLACAYARARGADRMSSFGDFISLYVVLQMDPSYQPAQLERKQVYGVTFEQGRQNLVIDDAFLQNVVTRNKEFSPEAIRDIKISLITLKYTQSNSVCFVKDGQAIGIGAGQQSRVHCTRLAGSKADNWYLRQCPKVLDLPFREDIRRADRDNAIDIYIGEWYEDVLADGAWQKIFTRRPEVFTAQEKREWLDTMTEVTLGSDAFFPFSDNIERAYKSGVKYVAEPGGSVRDDAVIECCDKYGMAMVFTGIRLFHH